MTGSAPEAPLLRIDTLTKTFGGFVALDNINVEIRKGERFGLIGPNGSGKTTLVNCISGALRPNKGAVTFAGENITPLPANQRSHRGIARSFQLPRPFRSMTVLENLMVALDFAAHGHLFETEAHRREEAMSILTRIGLASKALSATGALTQVELRKMELARAMATGPKLLISDEAMAGLSTSEVDEVLDLLLSLGGQDIAIIMIEHIMQAVMRFSERVMCLDAGKVIAIGPPGEVMSIPRVQEAYLGTEPVDRGPRCRLWRGQGAARRLEACRDRRDGGVARDQRQRQEHADQMRRGPGEAGARQCSAHHRRQGA
jgi:branched-chain amino acid transport system ATP-binding protein